jgi:uncharacterized membrane protein
MDVLNRARIFAAPTVHDREFRGEADGTVRRVPSIVVLAGACVAAVWIAVQLWRRDDGLGTPAYDQAFFQQLIWNLDHGRGFVSSFNQNSFLGLHFSPLLVVPAALEMLWTDPRILGLITAASLALAAPAAFLFLRAALEPSRLGSYLAAGLAIALPFIPTMQEAARADFHPEVIALPAALAAGWAGLTRRPLVMWLSGVVVLAAKEDQVYTAAVIGLLVAVRGRRGMRRHGTALMSVAIAWGAALFLVIMPALRGSAEVDTGHYYGWLGTGPSALLAPITEPVVVWAQISNPAGWGAALVLVASCCFLPVVRPRWAILMVPPLVANLLSHNGPQPAGRLQYGLLLVVPALVATAMGGRAALARIEQYRRTRLRRPPARRLVPAVIMGAVPGLVLGATLGTLPPNGHAASAFMREPGLSRLAAIVSVIPSGAPVAADDDVAAPLASRAEVRVLPSLCSSCYVVVDRDPGSQTFMTPEQRAALLAKLPQTRRLLADDGRFQVWSPAGG